MLNFQRALTPPPSPMTTLNNKHLFCSLIYLMMTNNIYIYCIYLLIGSKYPLYCDGCGLYLRERIQACKHYKKCEGHQQNINKNKKLTHEQQTKKELEIEAILSFMCVNNIVLKKEGYIMSMISNISNEKVNK